MLKAVYTPYRLIFKETAITSRAAMEYKDTYFVKVWDDSAPSVYGLGECALFKGLSAEDKPDYEDVLRKACRDIDDPSVLSGVEYSSILFGLRTALLDLGNGGQRIIFPSDWTTAGTEIPINGLVWMGSIDQMRQRVKQKLDRGFRCVKFKIGGQDFNQELALLKQLRRSFSASDLEIRLDANGAFTPQNALDRLKRLSELEIHSIEQPIKAGQWSQMACLCLLSPIPIALDEELIGMRSKSEKEVLLDAIRPQYIILKPALCGGIGEALEWTHTANARGIGWWVTSALESNIGLNAIAQWVATLNTSMPQGLGTGALYVNNIPLPIEQVGTGLRFNKEKKWEIPGFQWIEP